MPRYPRLRLFSCAAALCLLLAAGPAGAVSQSRNVQLLAHLDAYPGYSACTSYIHSDGSEYAVIGTHTGTSIVNVTNPAAPYEVGFIPGLTSIWREMKQYRNWIYVSTEAAGGGIQIIRMTDPENPVLAGTYTATFNRAHSVTVDTTRALLILNGTRTNNTASGMQFLSLANPESPSWISSYTIDYVHDSWMRGTRLHAFHINSGTVHLFDTSDPTLIEEEVLWSYPNSRSHSGETSKDGRYLYVCDEENYSTLKVFDIQNIFAHPMVYETTVNPLAIVHNVHVKEDTAFVAWYTEGVHLFDLTDPSLPARWGWYDTYPGFSGGFHGVWEVACGFPSGTFIASDIETGLYVFRATPQYGVVKVRARNTGGQPLSGVDVVRVGSPDDSTRTGATGGARLGLAPGTATIKVSKFGYEPQFVTATVAVGSQDSFVVTMSAIPSTTLSGVVRRSPDDAGVPDAEITLEETPLTGTSAAGGAYAIGSTPRGVYTVRAYRPGYAPVTRATAVEPGVPRSVDFKLVPAAWYDSCDTDRGWSLADPDDNASAGGLWTRAVPNGTTGQNAPAWRGGFAAGSLSREPLLGAQHDEPAEGLLPIGPVAPGTDATPGAGGYCFVTGNGPAGASATNYDVDLGKTTLTSPPLNLAGMTEPTISWKRWFHMNTPGEPDSFTVQITANGTSWVTVLSTVESHAHWHLDVIRVKDYIVPSATVRIRFIARDEGPVEGTVEAGVDDFMAYDAALTPSGVPGEAVSGAPPAVLESPRPNPASREASVTLRLRAPGDVRVGVFDASGRLVARLFEGAAPAGALPLRWNGRDVRGREAGSGVYWIRAEAAGERFTTRLVWVR